MQSCRSIDADAQCKRALTLHYRPQRSWAEVIFSQACVCPQGGRGVCLSACWDTPPPRSRPPPGPDTPSPRTRHPPREHTPPRPGTDPQTPPPPTRHPSPPTRHTSPPPREADCSIRLTSGRYASYWNAFLFTLFSVRQLVHAEDRTHPTPVRKTSQTIRNTPHTICVRHDNLCTGR